MTAADDELRALAEAACEGPWTDRRSDNPFEPCVAAGGGRGPTVATMVRLGYDETRANAAFMAAANPAAVLDLLDRLESAEAQVEALTSDRPPQKYLLGWDDSGRPTAPDRSTVDPDADPHPATPQRPAHEPGDAT